MVKLSQKNKDRLVRIMQDERAEERCILIQGYKKEAKELTFDYDGEIDLLRKQHDKLALESTNVKREIDEVKTKKEELLKENNLLNFNTTYGTCSLGGKPLELETFDIKTRNMEKEILER